MQDRGIGCRSLKVDRWIGYRSSTAKAELLTHAIQPGRSLHLNAKTEPGGWICVGVIDSWGQEFVGFSADDCVKIEGDSLQHAIGWVRGKRLPKTDSEIRLLYSDNYFFRRKEMASRLALNHPDARWKRWARDRVELARNEGDGSGLDDPWPPRDGSPERLPLPVAEPGAGGPGAGRPAIRIGRAGRVAVP